MTDPERDGPAGRDAALIDFVAQRLHDWTSDDQFVERWEHLDDLWRDRARDLATGLIEDVAQAGFTALRPSDDLDVLDAALALYRDHCLGRVLPPAPAEPDGPAQAAAADALRAKLARLEDPTPSTAETYREALVQLQFRLQGLQKVDNPQLAATYLSDALRLIGRTLDR